MYLDLFIDVLRDTLTITCLVMIMMLLIEFVNVGSAGKWMQNLHNRPFLQILLATLLGLVPGCIGGFAIVSLFTHNLMSFGALVAGMIATFGDEAFVMMAYSPKWTLILSVVLLVIAVVAGLITHLLFKNKHFALEQHSFEVHEEHEHQHAKANLSLSNLKNISFPRALLIFGLIIYIVAILTGAMAHHHGGMPGMEHHHHTEAIAEQHQGGEEVSATEHHCHRDECEAGCEHHHDEMVEAAASEEGHHHHEHEHGLGSWENIFFLVLACITLVVVALSSEHFLQSHLWEHVIKHHFLSVFLWTFGVLAFLKVLYLFVDVNTLITDNRWALWGLMLLAIFIGIIPESGPHLIFVVMFFSGAIPFSILLVSSIVQDGHGALPLLAQSRKNFFLMKGLNMAVGLIVGVLGLLLGF